MAVTKASLILEKGVLSVGGGGRLAGFSWTVCSKHSSCTICGPWSKGVSVSQIAGVGDCHWKLLNSKKISYRIGSLAVAPLRTTSQ